MRPLALLLLVGLAAPGALAQSSVYDRILAVSGDPYADAWASGAKRVLVAQYDRNRSGSLDTRAEVDAVECSAWEALQDAVPQGILPIYGFDPGYSWVGGSLGFDEAQRARAFAAGTRCLGGIAIADQIRSLPDAGSTTWKEEVGAILVSEYDRDRSGAIGGDEAPVIPCDVWSAIEARYALGPYTRFWVSYGFQDGLIWNAAEMGFDESAREPAYADMAACPRLFDSAESAPAVALPASSGFQPDGLQRSFTQRLDDELSATDRTLRSGEYVDTWLLDVEDGQQITVEVASDAFDPYIILKSPSGQQLDNDDWEGSTRLARIVHDDAEAGQWQILATSYRAGATGAYGVTLSAAYPSDGLGSPTARAGLVGTTWAEDCPGSNPSRSYVRLNADGTFAWSERSGDDVETDDGESWAVENGQLVISWNNRYAVSRYRLTGDGILSGTTSKTCGSAIRLLMLP